jgi:transposase
VAHHHRRHRRWLAHRERTAARLIARPGDPRGFYSAGAVASFVGVVPATRQSRKKQRNRAGITPIDDAALRSALWMPSSMLTAVRKNAWLKAHYQRLLARGKLAGIQSVALIACMRKLLAAIYSVAKHRRPFVPLLPARLTTP